MRNRTIHAPEEGATATLFLLSLFVFLGIAMLAIDVGFLMMSRRGQIADTDSAALAAAQAMIDNRCANDPTAEATTYANLNDPATRVDDVTVTPTTPLPAGPGCEPLSGVVTVTTSRDSTLIFAPLFGFNRVETGVISGAAYGQIEELQGLRPIGLCTNDPHFTQEWRPYLTAARNGGSFDMTSVHGSVLTAYNALYGPTRTFTQEQLHPTSRNGTPYPAGAVVHRFVFQAPEAGNSCGQGPAGNFGWLDFDGDGGGDVPEECPAGVTPRSELNCDVAAGFQGLVGLKPADCDPTSSATKCLSQPGEVAAAREGLEHLRCPANLHATDPSCETVYIVVYGVDPVDAGGASDEQFEIVAATGLVVRDYRATGSPNNHYLDVEFVDELEVGSIGPTDPTSTSPLGVALCLVDNVDKCDYGP